MNCFENMRRSECYILKKKSIKDMFILLWSNQSTLIQTSMSITEKHMDQKKRSNGKILQLIYNRCRFIPFLTDYSAIIKLVVKNVWFPNISLLNLFTKKSTFCCWNYTNTNICRWKKSTFCCWNYTNTNIYRWHLNRWHPKNTEYK